MSSNSWGYPQHYPYGIVGKQHARGYSLIFKRIVKVKVELFLKPFWPSSRRKRGLTAQKSDLLEN